LINLLNGSSIVFIHAGVLSFESIIAELLHSSFNIPALAIAAISIPIAGATLLSSFALRAAKNNSRVTVFKLWKFLIPASILLAIGIFTWYDSVSRIGASKDGLLAGPLETVTILFLARFFLGDRLSKPQTLGIVLALVGFFLTLGNGSMFSQLKSSIFTIGDIEAIISSITFATGYIYTTKLVRTCSTIEVTGSCLLFSGLILMAIFSISTASTGGFSFPNFDLNWISLQNCALLMLFSLVPLSSALFYNMGLNKIGASLTSTISSSTILLTIIFQVSLYELGINSILPVNIPMAITGAILGIFGICVVHMNSIVLFIRIWSICKTPFKGVITVENVPAAAAAAKKEIVKLSTR
jgi:drug/metabolite transporter (DMT)-like permease